MEFSRLKRAAALIAAAIAAAGAAEPDRSRAPISIDAAASSEIDYANNRAVFRDVTISQGDITVRAARAQAEGLDTENSRWDFDGNVEIRVERQGMLRSDRAVIEIRDSRIVSATITGSPARFEQRLRDSGQLAQGRAGSIVYTVGEGTVRLAEDAWLTYGGNEITGPLLVYDIRAERLRATAQPGGDERVRITIVPRQDGTAETPR